MIVKEPWYSRIKWFVMIVLPAISAAYFSLSDLFDLDNALQVMGVCSILATFLGAVLLNSNKNYQASEERYDGDMVVTETEDGDTFRLALNAPPEILAAKGEVTFKRVVEQG
jgi:hypothetical protein